MLLPLDDLSAKIEYNNATYSTRGSSRVEMKQDVGRYMLPYSQQPNTTTLRSQQCPQVISSALRTAHQP